MSKILFDTNVVIAAFLTKGNCSEIIKNAIGVHEIYYTAFILNEVDNKLKNKFKFDNALRRDIISFIKEYFVVGKTALEIKDVCRDKKDDYILADAFINDVDYIVTGDKDLLELKKYKHIKIIKPSSYWEI